MQMSCLFICVALVLVSISSAEYQWSGFVNNVEEDFDFMCPDNLAITGIASQFNDAIDDRRWEFQCASGGGVANVTSNCTLQDGINELRMEFNYECPDDGYIAGFKSEYSSSDDDRVWYPYCCTRPYSSLVNCHVPSSAWENSLEGLLNWTTTSERVLTGVVTFFASFNKDRRWRFQQCEIEVSCGDPGIPENAMREGDSFLYEDTVVFTCNNGYYQSSGAEGGVRVCQDTGIWSNTQPECSLCTNIENCADIRCTNPTDHYCEECESDNGVALGERGYENLNFSCEPLCSWLQAFCYPGECPGGITSCNCTNGFTGSDCLSITTEPDLETCTIQITSPSTLTSTCYINVTDTHYINYIPTGLTARWDTSFSLSSAPPEPQYVDSYSIGISEASVVASVYRMDSYPTDSSTTTIHPCESVSVSSDNPMTIVDCETTLSNMDLSNHTFLHGDWFKVSVFISNGGFLNITNLDANETDTYYYTGTPIAPYSLFVIDTQPPTHCSVVISQTCLTNQNVFGESLVFNTLTLTWGGWSDIPSKIAQYRIEVYELIYDSGAGYLDVSETIDVIREPTYELKDSYSESVSLLSEGPYSVILIASDTAGNSQYARRIVVYDYSSELKEDTEIPLVIISGFAEGNAFWQNSTTSSIIVNGEGHFYDTNLKTSNWLAPVVSHNPSVPTEFDDDDRFGVNNSLGITSLSYQYVIDQVGGTSPAAQTQPVSFPFDTDDLALEAVQVNPEVEDGDSVTIWFEARDFKDNDPVYESVLVHIDSSSPVVEGLGLVKEGVSEFVSLYGSEDFLKLDVQFQAVDTHSGLSRIEWRIETQTGDIGNGLVPVPNYEKDDCLLDSDCICDTVEHCHKKTYTITFISSDFTTTKAKHDTDYYLTITAYNHAQLPASLTHQFTVDLTPPLSGNVFEGNGENGILDLDYQESLSFMIWWEGFFDRETSILTYQYIIDIECKTASSFQYPNLGSSPAIATNKTSIKWTATTAGIYYTTVVAYNGPYLSSDPVCSDGITIDMEPPVIKGVYIPGAQVHEGLVNSGEEVWLIHKNRERSLVVDASESCFNGSFNISEEEIFGFPIKYNGSLISTISSVQCSNYPPFKSLTYTPVDTVLNITWTIDDNTGIRDYQFGISTTYNTTSNPDIIPLTSTTSLSHFSAFNSHFTKPDEFYVIIKAIDLSMQETVAIVGPVIIDTSPPLVNSTVESNVENGLMVIWWDEWTIADSEDVFPLSFEYAIGRKTFGENVVSFTSIPSISPQCPTPFCVSIDIETLGFKSGNEYHITLRSINTAGLVTNVPIDPYTMPFKLDASCLSIFEYDTQFDIGDMTLLGFLSQEYDYDIIFNSTAVSIGWKGLGGDYRNATFSVALGTKPGWSDIIPFEEVENGNLLTLRNLSLVPGNIYYSSVKATNSYGTVTVTSDGFLVLEYQDNDGAIWNGLSDEYNEEYRLSSTEISAHWYYPNSISQYISHYEWALFRTNDNHDLENILEYTNVGTLKWATRPVQLSSGLKYISAVKACFKSVCLKPVYSDVFYIASYPNSSSIIASYEPITVDDYGYSTSGYLNISWSPFKDQVGIGYYEWAVGTSADGVALITQWNRVSPETDNVNVTIYKTISLHDIYYVTLRGVNIAGLESQLSTDMTFIGDHIFKALTVYDVNIVDVPVLSSNNPLEIEYHDITYTELDYTNSNSSLSAVWPDLRYSQYNYSISTSPEFKPCGDPYSIACGSTIANGMTVSELELTHGQTYYFCVQAKAENAYMPGAESVTRCSDGIMAYLVPPKGVCVQIKPSYELDDLPELTSGEVTSGETEFYAESYEEKDSFSCINRYGSQASTSELHVVWDSFLEEFENGPHEYGVAYYEYAIGTTIGSEDVVQFTNVGVVNAAIATGLLLKHGLTYYATIRATDHTGQKSTITSEGLRVDRTPPTFGQIWLNTPTTISITSLDQLLPKWELVTDEQSDVSILYWSLGSENGLSDLHEWTPVNVTAVSGKIKEGFSLPDGQPLRLNLLAVNNAGLVAVSSSKLIIYDSTPPCPGQVFDGPKPILGFLDIDYTRERNYIHAHWEPFSDPHTYVTEYLWAIGTCKNCTDVMPFISVGLYTDATRKYLYAHGQTYYISVKGCSIYSGCSISHSDGVTIDATGPVIAQLTHGLPSNPLIQFQASRHTIACHWSGIFDSESGIAYYIYYAGTEPGDNSYIAPIMIPSSQTSFVAYSPFNAVELLPIDEMVYVTLEVYNGVGDSNNITSAGVYISDVPPIILDEAFIDVDWSGSLVTGTQYSYSALRLSWNFSDTLTSIDQHFWSLIPDEGTYLPITPQIYGTVSYATITNSNLADGSTLVAIVTACNQAGLCVQNATQSVLIDSSRPIDGYFAVETESAASVSWAISDGMTIYNNVDFSITELNLTFTGFSDPHSGVSEYWATVGSYYGGDDLYESSLPLPHELYSSNSNILVSSIQLARYLNSSEVVYVSLWAFNGVGLKSRTVQGSFQAIYANSSDYGTLKLLRSQLCPIDSCLGHCTCDKPGYLCDVTSTCYKLNSTELSSEFVVMISNFVPQLTFPLSENEPLFTAVTDKLAANIEYGTDSPVFQWIEWSVSEKGSDPGSSVVDLASDPVWFPLEVNPIFDVSQSYPLEEGNTYIFHTRVWYNSSHYATFQSEGVTIDSNNPQILVGRRIKEIMKQTNSDVDFISSTSELTLEWRDVFNQVHSGGFLSYEVGIGESPGSDNLFGFSSVNSDTSINISELSLRDNRKYFTTVRATNTLGITVASVSDGISIDLTPPVKGAVFNGLHNVDYVAQSNLNISTTHLFGFHDPQSGIHHYEIAFTDSPNNDSLIFINIGIQQTFTNSNVSMEQGTEYCSVVKAENLAGLPSQTNSACFVADSTQPLISKCNNRSPNLIKSSSFETENNQCTVDGWILDECNNDECTLLNSEKLSDKYTVAAHTGKCSFRISNAISQTIQSSPNKEHILSFWRLIESGTVNENMVECDVVGMPGIHRTTPQWTFDDENRRWQKHVYTFTPSSSTTTIHIRKVNYNIIIDSVEVTYCESSDTIDGNIFAIEYCSKPNMVAWPIYDLESGIKEYKYAIGTVPGGEQILPYQSTGDYNWGFYDLWNVKHNSSVYFSVVATNYAGISRVFYSEPVHIDSTPPVITGEGVKEVLEEGGDDIDYWRSDFVLLDWSGLVDEESGIKHCVWGLGSSPGLTDLRNYTVSNTTLVNATDLSEIHGDTMYTSVMCLNNAGYTTITHSDGVTLLYTAPKHELVSVSILNPVLTRFESQDGYTSMNSIQVIWDGFLESSDAPLYYQIRVLESGSDDDVEWTDVGALKQITIYDITAKDNVMHTIQVRAYAVDGLFSNPVSHTFSIIPLAPSVNSVDLNVTLVSEQLSLEWNGLFTSSSPLYYEVSIGTQMGSSSIRKWITVQETENNKIQITDTSLTPSKEYFVSLSGIAFAGVSTSVNYMITGDEAVKLVE